MWVTALFATQCARVLPCFIHARGRISWLSRINIWVVLLMDILGMELSIVFTTLEPMETLPEALHELPRKNGQHKVAKLVCRHAVQNMLLIDHVLVDDLGRFLLHLTASTVAIVPEQPGNGHGRQDVGLSKMAGQGQEELRLAELIICSWPHPSWNTGGCSVPGKSVSAGKTLPLMVSQQLPKRGNS